MQRSFDSLWQLCLKSALPNTDRLWDEGFHDLIPQGKENQFLDLAVRTHLAPLIHENLKGTKNIPEDFNSKLGNIRNQVLVRNIRLYGAFDQMLQLFNQESIQVIPLKGIYAADRLYQDLGLRHLSDIDILVRRENLDSICKLMQDQGWNVVKAISHSQLEAEKFEPAHPFTLVKDGISVELHTHLYSKGSGMEIPEDDLWNHAHQQAFRRGSIFQFEKPMLLQHWCLHLYKHLKGHEVKLVSFVDIHLILKRMSPMEMYSFWKLCDAYGCTDICSSILKIYSVHWGIGVSSIPPANDPMYHELETSFLAFVKGSVLKHRLNSRLGKVLAQSRSMEPSKRTEFILRYVFPNAAFMRKQYQLNGSTWLLPWYLFRFSELSVKLLKVFMVKFKANQPR